MSSGFRKFVEWATGSRYVPVGSCCSLCRKKLGFFRTGFWRTNASKLADGELCEKCAENVERLMATMPERLKADQPQQSSWIQYNAHNWHTLTVKNATEMIAAKDQETLSAFGRDKSNLFRIVEVVQIEPNALQVGVARAKRLRSKVAVFGMVERGSFSRPDGVQLEQQDASVGTTILEAYAWDCEENTLEINLRANMGKHRLVEGK